MEYQLVPMDRSHLSGVAELERLCFSTPWNETMSVSYTHLTLPTKRIV